MTNEEVKLLLKDAQVFWKKWRDTPPGFRDIELWEYLNNEALDIVKKHGNTEHGALLMAFFKEELHLRSQEAEHGTK